MKEKQFDHIDNKIREAAENVEPGFDEHSWDKMEKLLDKEKQKRRPFWIIIPFLFCSIITGYLLLKPKSTGTDTAYLSHTALPNENPTATLSKTTSPTLTEAGSKVLPTKESISAGLDKSAPEAPVNPLKSMGAETSVHQLHAASGSKASQASMPNLYSGNRHNKPSPSAKHDAKGTVGPGTADLAGNGTPGTPHLPKNHGSKTRVRMHTSAPDEATSADPDENSHSTSSVETATRENTLPVRANDFLKVVAQKRQDTLLQDVSALPAKEPSKAKIKKPGMTSRLYFIALAGADAGSVKLFSLHNSSITAKYNLGVGYQFSKKISIQTGFNVSSKKYIAGPGDYNPKAGTYLAMVDIKSVNADCLVYEIPLAVRFNVVETKGMMVYATAGLSSYIMKKEDYDYYYVRSNLPYQHNIAYTGNKHLFSNLALSVGIEKKLSARFSLLAEPSVSTPLTGVGEGKVKLYSMGLQAGIKFSPFRKKK